MPGGANRNRLKPASPANADDFPEHVLARGEHESPERIFRRVLARRRLHYTRERIEVLREVLRTHDHFDASELHKRLQRRRARVSKATVYRTVSLLSESRIIREVFHSPQGARYEHVYGHKHHEHMICLACGKVTEFSSPELERIQEKACRRNGFRPTRHHLEVLGNCRACQPRLNQRESPA